MVRVHPRLWSTLCVAVVAGARIRQRPHSTAGADDAGFAPGHIDLSASMEQASNGVDEPSSPRPASAVELNEMFDHAGVLVRMLWNLSFCNGTLDKEWAVSEFHATNQTLYRSASFLRHDLPVAIANGNRFCPSLFEIGILLNPSTVGRGCAFHKDASTGQGHLAFAPGEDPDPDYARCNGSQGCKQCCNEDWNQAATQVMSCNRTSYNEFLAQYGRSDILALAYTVYEDQTPSQSATLYQRCQDMMQIVDADLLIVELRLPAPRDQPENGSWDANFQYYSSEPFSSPASQPANERTHERRR
jgi:hypothetical protein